MSLSMGNNIYRFLRLGVIVTAIILYNNTSIRSEQIGGDMEGGYALIIPEDRRLIIWAIDKEKYSHFLGKENPSVVNILPGKHVMAVGYSSMVYNVDQYTNHLEASENVLFLGFVIEKYRKYSLRCHKRGMSWAAFIQDIQTEKIVSELIGTCKNKAPRFSGLVCPVDYEQYYRVLSNFIGGNIIDEKRVTKESSLNRSLRKDNEENMLFKNRRKR